MGDLGEPLGRLPLIPFESLELNEKWLITVVLLRFLGFARNDDTREVIILHTSFTFLQKGASSRHSILRLRRAPSSRGCSAGM